MLPRLDTSDDANADDQDTAGALARWQVCIFEAVGQFWNPLNEEDPLTGQAWITLPLLTGAGTPRVDGQGSSGDEDVGVEAHNEGQKTRRQGWTRCRCGCRCGWRCDRTCG